MLKWNCLDMRNILLLYLFKRPSLALHGVSSKHLNYQKVFHYWFILIWVPHPTPIVWLSSFRLASSPKTSILPMKTKPVTFVFSLQKEGKQFCFSCSQKYVRKQPNKYVRREPHQSSLWWSLKLHDSFRVFLYFFFKRSARRSFRYYPVFMINR